MKKHYLSALVLALFTATASAQITTKDQAKAHIEALRVADTEAADDAISAVNAASNEAGYNDAVKTFYQAINGSRVYFTNSARGGGKSYLTLLRPSLLPAIAPKLPQPKTCLNSNTTRRTTLSR